MKKIVLLCALVFAFSAGAGAQSWKNMLGKVNSLNYYAINLEKLMSKIVGVLLPLPFNDVFDYKTEDNVSVGDLVSVSFGNPRQGREHLVGVVWKDGKSSDLSDEKIKPINSKLNYPPLSEEIRKFISFTASYNMSFLGMVLKMVLSVKAVFEDPKLTALYTLSGKTLAEAKIKNDEELIDSEKLVPFYLRLPQAERELKLKK